MPDLKTMPADQPEPRPDRTPFFVSVFGLLLIVVSFFLPEDLFRKLAGDTSGAGLSPVFLVSSAAIIFVFMGLWMHVQNNMRGIPNSRLMTGLITGVIVVAGVASTLLMLVLLSRLLAGA